MTIVVTGGSGMVGSALIRALLSKGHTVIVIDRIGPGFTHEHLFYIPCDLTETTLPFNVLERTDAVVNLIGSPIGRKWTPRVKQEIFDSRVIGTRHVVESLAQTASKPSIFISASATGYYGEAEDELLDERAPQGNSFLSGVAAAWETEAMKAEQFGSRVVIVRTAPVLARGGFLGSSWKHARWHLCGSLFKKDFWMPWIHINDLVRVYLFALETSTLQGIVNAAAPTHTRYRELMRAFRAVTRSIGLGRNRLAALFLGKELLENLSQNQKVVPQRLIDKGFEFAFTDAESALRSLKEDHESR